jgi:hypothetical protein
VIFSAAVVGILVMGCRLLRRAAACAEVSDFRRVGDRLHWNIEQFGGLAGPVGAFVREVLAETSVAGRIDLVCERLAEVDVETRQVPCRLAMLARTTLVMGGFCGIILVSQAVRDRSGSMVVVGLAPVVLSGAAAFCCRWMGRMVSSELEFRRQSWDLLSRLLLRPHMAGLCVEGGAPDAAPDNGYRACARFARGFGGSRDRRRKVNDGVMFGVR